MPSIIVKITTDTEHIGYGEGVADEHVTGESWYSTYEVIKHTLAPKLIGQNPQNMEKIHELMDAEIYRAPTAKAAMKTACYIVFVKELNEPVYNLIDAVYNHEFQIKHELSIHEPD